MPLFDINYNNLVTQLLPVRLRNTKMVHWLQCLASPVVWLYSQFSGNRTANLYLLAHTSQVVFLQAVLNDTFDAISRGIYIVDGAYEDPLFIYLDPENISLWTGTITEEGSTTYNDPGWLYTTAETGLSGYSFIVKVPVTVSFDTSRMRALIDRYRLPGRNVYNIVTF